MFFTPSLKGETSENQPPFRVRGKADFQFLEMPLISKGESEIVEFKTNFNIETIETLVAFANSKGGSVFIGVNDKSKVVGVNANSENIQNWLNEIKNKTIPSIIPDVEEVFNGFKVTIFKAKSNVTENVTETRQLKILQLIKENDKISTTEIAKLIGVVRRTIARDIDTLKEKGVIKRIGPDKGGYWEVQNA